MRRLAMQDGIASSTMSLVLQNGLNVLLVTDMHDAAGRQAVFAENVKEQLDWGNLQCARDLV
jgi:hypothetical protein